MIQKTESTTDDNNELERAILIATKAHQGQRDKAGLPYIFHPLRIMLKQKTSDAMIVGVLHDVVEDTDITLEHLKKEGFSPSVLDAVKLLTHNKDVPYMDYIQDIALNLIAKHVKVADLMDNMDLSRLPSPTPKDIERLRKYQIALQYLQEYL